MSIQVLKPRYEVEECLSEIKECLEIGWTGMGFKTEQFENAWKKYTGLSNAYYLNSATAGLYLAFDVLKRVKDWDDGDEVITTPMTFVSTNHAILKAGLKPVFADIDDTMCLDPKSVERAISKKTKAVIFVGIGGNTGHLEEIASICRENNLILVLDAAHMSGTRLNGSCPSLLADVSIYSFQAVKNLPTADSGILCFRDEQMDEMARKIGWLGINKDTYSRSGSGGTYKWRYDVEFIGEKYHGNSVMAAIGLVQLKYLDRDNAYRRQLAHWYREQLQELEGKIKFVDIPSGCESSFHIFQIMVEDRDGLMEHLNQHDIYPGVHYVENTEYSMFAYAHGTCPKAEYASAHTITLPMHLGVTREDVNNICELVREFLCA